MRMVENTQISSVFLPVDLGTAQNGDYHSMKGYKHATLIFFKAIGTAGDDPTITVQQAKTVAGGSVKELEFTEIYTKQAATNLLAVGQFTRIDQTASETYTDDTSAEEAAIWVIEIDADDLDVENGFDCLRFNIADIGSNAQLGCGLIVLSEPRDATDAASQLSAIAD